jgi:hypothetical protein
MIQFDIKIAFLHGKLEEEIYIEEPKDYYVRKESENKIDDSSEEKALKIYVPSIESNLQLEASI